jgi:hypothetical protein
MSIHGYIWLCIENEEEVTVEEERRLLHQQKIHLSGTIFILISLEQSPTPLQHKASPGAFATCWGEGEDATLCSMPSP